MTLSLPVMADQQAPSNKGYAVLAQNKSNGNRPKAPTTLFVGCEYGDGFLVFTLPESVGMLTFILYKDGEVISGMATSEDPCVEIPSLHGEYNIECVDDGNRTYTGVLDFQ